jgi:hypothetical protein
MTKKYRIAIGSFLAMVVGYWLVGHKIAEHACNLQGGKWLSALHTSAAG